VGNGPAQRIAGLFLKSFRADLHIHTVLSPCAEIEMLPSLIVQEALDRGISLIAITDHNATDNIDAVQKAAKGTDLIVIPGMELQTREEVHVLCLFDTLEQAKAFQRGIDPLMPDIENNPEYFGVQLVVDLEGEILRQETRMLLTSANISIEKAVQITDQLGGLLIPAHVNRKGFGLIEMLGFVPQDIRLEALEISRHLTPDQAYRQFPQIVGYPLIQNGDAHRLQDILGATSFVIEKPSIAEIRLALNKQDGRSFHLLD
jgi:PHP family Zn ribbon phosphoesterase